MDTRSSLKEVNEAFALSDATIITDPLHRVHGQVREVLAQVAAANTGLSKPIPRQLAAHGDDLQSLGGGELTGVAQAAGQDPGGAAIVLGGS